MKVFGYSRHQELYEPLIHQVEQYAKKTGGVAEEIKVSHDRIHFLHQLEKKKHNLLLFLVTLEDRKNTEKLAKVMNRLLDMEGLGEVRQEGRRAWFFNRRIIVLDIEDIYYFESYQRMIKVCTYSRKYRINTTISKEADALEGSGFVRVHHGYLVQKSHIRSMEQCQVILKNGERVPVSKRYKKELIQQLDAYNR